MHMHMHMHMHAQVLFSFFFFLVSAYECIVLDLFVFIIVIKVISPKVISPDKIENLTWKSLFQHVFATSTGLQKVRDLTSHITNIYITNKNP